MSYIGQYDGGARGNGSASCIAGSGSVLIHNKEEIWSDAHLIPDSADNTNNTAEYMGLIRLLIHITETSYPDMTSVCIQGDSLLVTEQINHTFVPGHKGWVVRKPHLLQFHQTAMTLLNQISKKGIIVNLVHVRREFNKRADQLSNIAMDTHIRSIPKKKKVTSKCISNQSHETDKKRQRIV